MKKTRTFQLQKACVVLESPPRAPPPPPLQGATSHVPRKSPLIEFPTSPQLIMGDDILHFSHPQHPLSQINLPDLFTCAGCKEYGAGNRFTCQQCQFELHEFCALAPPALKSHPFHLQHHLLFYSKPAKSGILNSRCDICGKPTKGYNFRCTVCGFQMHPCCAMLSTDINYIGHPHAQLKLLPVANSTLSNGGTYPADNFVCRECNRKRSGRVYRCADCDYHLHAVCAKNMVNGLQANGHKGKEKASMLGTAARIASQVVIEFIGGLVEGIGEGVGQVLIQSVARGENNTNTRPRRSTTE